MYIYKTINLINNKVYIGKSEKEFDGSYYGSGILLWKAIKKYGIENFKVEVIETCQTMDFLNQREIYWIDQYKDHSYNIAKGGTGGDTIQNHPDKEAIIKRRNASVSKSLIGHPVSEDTRRKISEKKKGQTLTEEQRKKISETAKRNGISGGDRYSNRSEELLEIKRRSLLMPTNIKIVINSDQTKILTDKLFARLALEDLKLLAGLANHLQKKIQTIRNYQSKDNNIS